MNPERILFVDDEPNVLEGIRRTLRNDYQLLFAASPTRGIELARKHPDLAVVVSDLRMPEADGANFLAAIRQLRPDVIRLVLSGAADLDHALTAVNRGQLFRYLTKPVSRESLVEGLEAALAEFRRQRGEQELLESTVAAAVGVLAEALSLANPLAFNRSGRILAHVTTIAADLGLALTWEVRVAGLLSQLGCLSLSPQLLRKVASGQDLDPEERDRFDRHPDVAAAMIRRIPRLEGVAELVAAQRRSVPVAIDDPHRRLAALVIRAASEYDLLLSRGVPRDEIVSRLDQMGGDYSSDVLRAVGRLRFREDRTEVRRVTVDALTPDMVFEQDVTSLAGVLLVPSGQRVTETVVTHLANFAHGVGITEPVVVRVPVGGPQLDVETVIAAVQHRPDRPASPANAATNYPTTT